MSLHFDVRRHFVDHLSYNPLSANAKNKLMYRPADEAQKMRYISPDLPYAIQALKLDMDDVGSGDHTAVRWLDAAVYQPHFIVCNPQGRSSHYIYMFKVPVDKSVTGRRAPLSLFRAVQNGYTRILGADRAYSGVAVKNPLHKHWDTITYNAPLLTLGELLDALPEDYRHTPARGESLGEGRNVELFDNTRHWAYGEVASARKTENFGRWQKEVLAEARQGNVFTDRLPTAEVQSIARSIAGWTWRNAHTLSERSGSPRKRSQIYSYNRVQITPEEAVSRMQEGGAIGGRIGGAAGGVLGAPITNAIRRNKTYDAITGAIATLVGAGTPNPSAAQISMVSGVSVRSVRSYRRSERMSSGN